MEKFRKNPELIEAEQWLGTEEQVERFLAEGVIINLKGLVSDGSCLVSTLEGNIPCRLNDYLVKGADAVYSVYDGKLFEDNFELVEGDVVNQILIPVKDSEVVSVVKKSGSKK